jgi:hypothetical protein
MRFDVFAAPIAFEAGRRLATSAMPDAPIVAARRRRKRLRLRSQEA